MLRKLLISAAALSFVAPASAASIQVNFGANNPIPGNNDFQTQLNALGFVNFATLGSSLIADGPLMITFEYFGSESAYSDRFTAGAATYAETVNGVENKFGPTAATPLVGATPVLIGSASFVVAAGTSLAGLLNFSTTNAGGANATVGQDGFGIFLKAGQVTGQSFTTLWFGYDDQITGADDNHDDFIVRASVSAIPEPATWAMMVGGVGIAGMALRRRRRTASATVMA